MARHHHTKVAADALRKGSSEGGKLMAKWRWEKVAEKVVEAAPVLQQSIVTNVSNVSNSSSMFAKIIKVAMSILRR